MNTEGKREFNKGRSDMSAMTGVEKRQAIRAAIPPKPVQENSSPQDPLPEHRVKQVEAGLALYQKVLAERDELERKFSEALVRIDGLTTQLNALQGIVNMMESTFKSTEMKMQERIDDYQRGRDHAVSEAVALRTVLANIHTMLQSALNEQ